MLPISTHGGNWNNPIVALFTATSAVCVTGLAVVDTGEYFSFWGQLFILLLIQVGGLGYMMITTFLILVLGGRFDLRRKTAIQESFDRPFLQGSRNLVRSILATTLIFELTGAILLFGVFAQDFPATPRAVWLAVFHSISSWNNAGFSLFSNSLVDYQSSLAINLIVPGLVIFGGIGYQVIIEMYAWLVHIIRRNPAKFVFSLNFKVVTSTTLVLLILGTIAFFAVELNTEAFESLSIGEKFLAAWFQSMTTRTAGFNTISIGSMTTAGLFITMSFMFIGASPSGTGGGIKTTTIRVLISCTKSILQGSEDVILYQRQVPINLILKAIGVLVGSATTIVVATMIISLTDANFEFLQLFFEVISAFATVGLSTGITAGISSLGKLILVCTMYIGRVGILIFMATILGEPRPSRVQYPEQNLLVG